MSLWSGIAKPDYFPFLPKEAAREVGGGFRMGATPALLPEKSHGRRSLIGYSTWGRKESDTTEQLHFHLYFCGRV